MYSTAHYFFSVVILIIKNIYLHVCICLSVQISCLVKFHVRECKHYKYIHFVYIYIYIFIQLLHTSSMRPKVSSKWSLMGLNLVFSSSETCRHIDVQKSLLMAQQYLAIAGRRIVSVRNFPRV